MFPATLQHILVPVDFSEHSDHALDTALALARPAGARLTLLHVVSSPNDAGMSGFDLGDLLSALELSAREKLERQRAAVDVPCDAIVKVGSPYLEVLWFIEQQAPDLVVMSTHGRTGLKRLMMGSIAERIVQHATCPVLVLPRQRP